MSDKPQNVVDQDRTSDASSAAADDAGAPLEGGPETSAASASESVVQGVVDPPSGENLELPPLDEPEPDDGSEVVPVMATPLSRPAAALSEAEQAAVAQKAAEAAGDIEYKWYILKVQSNREKSIAAALQRKVKVEGLDRYFDKDEDGNPLVKVPTEKVTEFKAGKKKIVERKLYPGYIVVKMHITEETWFAVRETSGIGDFTGAGGKPSPMLPHEVARIEQSTEEESDEAPKLDIKFKVADRVKVKDGTFEGFEGEVGAIDAQSGKISVMINIFGRSTPVELEYWQVEGV
ncbi:MAG TPA: transcription termination/antitermination protein NusG [Lacipirellulaceae bacterium]|nr:transcription termination/antitermination protein NusG [Lacipirellulaceae bacterium]